MKKIDVLEFELTSLIQKINQTLTDDTVKEVSLECLDELSDLLYDYLEAREMNQNSSSEIH